MEQIGVFYKMSYLLNTASTVLRTPKYGQLLASCSDTPVTSSSICTFSTPANQGYNPYTGSELTIATTSTANDTLTLGAGYWLLQCFLGFENNNGTSNHATYEFELSGSTAGTQGATDISQKSSLDDCCLRVYVPTGSTKDVRLLINSVVFASGTLQVDDDYTSLLIDYVSI